MEVNLPEYNNTNLTAIAVSRRKKSAVLVECQGLTQRFVIHAYLIGVEFRHHLKWQLHLQKMQKFTTVPGPSRQTQRRPSASWARSLVTCRVSSDQSDRIFGFGQSEQ